MTVQQDNGASADLGRPKVVAKKYRRKVKAEIRADCIQPLQSRVLNKKRSLQTEAEWVT